VLRATGQNLACAGCVAYAAAACLNGQQIQATVDLAAPFAPLIARLLGPGVATCPVSSAVVPTTTNTGRGEWLFPTGAGRESDLLPPLPTARGKLILYLHGGAFVLCGAQTHRLISFEIVRRTGAVMLMPAYTRPPHCRYPTTLDECARIYCEVARRYSPENVIVMGDSAGGNLAVTTLLRACREGVPRPAGLVLMSPWVDLTEASLSAPSMVENERSDFIPRKLMRLFKEAYCDGASANGIDPADPLISPLYAEPAELAAALPRTLARRSSRSAARLDET